MTPDFLEVCEDYELAWSAIMLGADDEFREVADFLETEAVWLAVIVPRRARSSQ